MDKNQIEAIKITKEIEIEIKKMIKLLKKNKLTDEKLSKKIKEIYYSLGDIYLRTVLDNTKH
jgi:predicted translin family RNA/ssDNA-binding protein